MKGFEKFGRAIGKAMREDLQGLLESKEDAKRLMEEISKYTFDSGEPVPVGKRTPRQIYLTKMFNSFHEILRSMDTLGDIEFYISRFPYRTTSISKHRHLQFHAEAYLHEVYVLEQRLVSFLKVVKREHKKHPRIDEIKTACTALEGFVRTTLKKVTDLRSGHVHEARLSDKGIDRLGGIYLQISVYEKSKKISRFFRHFYQGEYLKTRKDWKKWIASVNKTAREILDEYFDLLYPLLFDEKDNSIIYPVQLKS